MQTRRTFFKALAAFGLCGSMLAGLSAFAPRADGADQPTPKEADVTKMKEALPDKAPAKPEKARKVLVYGNANGFVHGSIPLGCETIKDLGEKTGAWTATISYDPAAFDNLKDYDAVVLVSTTGHFLIPRGGDVKSPDPKKRSRTSRRRSTRPRRRRPTRSSSRTRTPRSSGCRT